MDFSDFKNQLKPPNTIVDWGQYWNNYNPPPNTAPPQVVTTTDGTTLNPGWGTIPATSGNIFPYQDPTIKALSVLIEWCGGEDRFIEIFKQMALPLKEFMDKFNIQSKDLNPAEEEKLQK